MHFAVTRFGAVREWQGSTWDSARLAREVERRAGTLSAMGVGRGARVAILHGNSARFLADLFAVWSVGAAASCLDDTLTPEELARILSFVGASAVLVDKDPAGRLPKEFPVPVVQLAASGRAPAVMPQNSAPDDSALDDTALILFTSGTTGTPKGVVLTFRAVLARVALNAAVIGRDALACALVTLPTHFGHGLIGNTLTPLMAGCDVVLHPPGLALARDLGRIVDGQRVSFMSSVPTLWRMALKSAAPPREDTLRRVHVGSAPLSAKLWSDIVAWSGAEVVNCYGLTETANWIAGASSRTDGIEEGLLGRPWGGMAAVRQENGAIRPHGEGEIVLQSPSLMTGYLDRPDLTGAALANGWYRTGDLGAVDAAGRIRMSGRLKDEINRAGFKVQPAEIDSLLETHTAVAEACVFGIADAVSGEVVAAAVRLEPGAQVDGETLAAWCRVRVRPAAVPERWFFVEEIPRNARGKVSRDAVRLALAGPEPASAQHGIADNAGGRLDAGAVKTAVARAWTSTLGRSALSADLTWDEAGGDSLQAMHAWFVIEEALGRRLPMEIFHERLRPGELAGAILSHADGQGGGNAGGRARAPLVFFFPPAGGDTRGCASFRAAFGGSPRFHLVHYPSLGEMIDAHAAFDQIVEATTRQLVDACEDGVFRIAGYSFGGCVAWEAARRLAASGRPVTFLGLIDTQAASLRWTQAEGANNRSNIAWTLGLPVRVIALLRTRLGRWKLADVSIEMLTRLRAFGVLRAMEAGIAKLPEQHAFRLRFRMAEHIRTVSLKRWGPLAAMDVPVTLFRADSFPENPEDLGWKSLAGNLTIVPVGGSHQLLEREEERGLLVKRFREGVLGPAPARSRRASALADDPVTLPPPPATFAVLSPRHPIEADPR